MQIRILALALLVALPTAATAQAPPPETVPAAATLPQVTLPAERTLTAPDGRQMAGTVLSKSDTGIKFRRTSDAKEFDIPLGKLSEEDRQWVNGTANRQIKALMFFSMDKEKLGEYLKGKVDVVDDGYSVKEITPQSVAQYDIIFADCLSAPVRKAINGFEGVILCKHAHKAENKAEVLEGKTSVRTVSKKPYIKKDGKFIWFQFEELDQKEGIILHIEKAKEAIDLAVKTVGTP